jgi:hypothetical protein
MYNCCNCDPRSDYMLTDDIAEYIADEMSDSRYYALLSEQAPTERGRDLLLEFSLDEWSHSQRLMLAYQLLTGRAYIPQPIADPVVSEYSEALKIRLLAETADYKKYGEKYMATCNLCLKEMFYTLRTYEGVHAMRMPLLMMGG